MRILLVTLVLVFSIGCVSAPPEGSLAAIKLKAYKEEYDSTWKGCMKSWSIMERETLGPGRNKIYGPNGVNDFTYCNLMARQKASSHR